MNVPQRRSVTGLGLLLFTGSAIAAPHGVIGGTEILLGLLLLCWIGFPLLLLGALAVQAVRSLFATPEHPLPVIPSPDTDLTA
jgi:hypothetical protein